MNQQTSNVVKEGARQACGFIAQLDPRARLFSACGLALSTVLTNHLAPLFLGLSVLVCLAWISGFSFKRNLKKILAMDVFMLYLLLILPFTKPGDPMLVLWGMEASWQGLEQALRIALKANTVVLLMLLLVSNMSVSALAIALKAMHLPHKLIQLMLFTMRYLEVIDDEYQRLRRSMRARGFVMRFNFHTWRSIGHLIAMLLLRALTRSQRVLNAMKCRGYQGELHYHYLLRWTSRDTRFILSTLVFVLSQWLVFLWLLG